jgi:predicted DNA-binding protein
MEVHFTPDLEKKLNELAAKTGRGADEIVQDVVAGYVDELAGVREMLDGRYDDLKSGRIKPVDGEAFFEQLRQREDERLKHSPQ